MGVPLEMAGARLALPFFVPALLKASWLLSSEGAKQPGPFDKSCQEFSDKLFCLFIPEISMFVKFDTAFAIITSGWFKGYIFRKINDCRRWYCARAVSGMYFNRQCWRPFFPSFLRVDCAIKISIDYNHLRYLHGLPVCGYA